MNAQVVPFTGAVSPQRGVFIFPEAEIARRRPLPGQVYRLAHTQARARYAELFAYGAPPVVTWAPAAWRSAPRRWAVRLRRWWGSL